MTKKGKKKRNANTPAEGGDAAGSSQQSAPQQETAPEAQQQKGQTKGQPRQALVSQQAETRTTQQPGQTPPQWPQAAQQPRQVAPQQPRQVAPQQPGQVVPQQPRQVAPQQPGQVAPLWSRTPQQPGQVAPQWPRTPQQPGQMAPQQPRQVAPQQPGQVALQQPGQVAPLWSRTPQQPGQVAPQWPRTPQQPGQMAPQQPRQVAPQQQPGQTPLQLSRTPQQPGQVAPQQPGQVAPQQPGQVAPQQPGQVAPLWSRTPQQPGQVAPLWSRTPQQPGQVAPQWPRTPQQPGQMAPQQPRQVAPQQQPGQTPLQLSRTPQQPGQVAPQQPGQVAPQQPGQVAPQQPGQVAPQQPGQVAPQQPHQTPSPKQQTSVPPSCASSVSSDKSRSSHSTPVIEYAQLPAMRSDVIKSTIPSDLALQYILQIPRRSNPLRGGTLGTPIKVETNVLKIIFSNNFKTNATHYDVSFEPDKPKFMLRPAYEKFRETHFRNRYPAFDGKKNVFSAGDLPFGSCINDTIKVYNKEREREVEFKIAFTKVGAVDLSWLKNMKPGSTDFERNQISVQILDVILRHSSASQCVTVGRSLFQPPQPGRVVSLSNGLDLWVGVFQSAIIGWKPYLNVDVAHKGFPTPQNVIDLFREMSQGRVDRYDRGGGGQGDQGIDPRALDRNKNKISKFLKGLKVQFAIPGQPGTKKVQRVNDLALCPRRNFFDHNGTQITVEKYFASEKNYRVLHPDLPCLWIGSRDRKVYVPAELCTIVAGQAVQKKMDEEQTSKMIKYAATGTAERKQKILNGFASMNVNNSPTVQNEFNLSVGGQFETIPARVLPSPKLMYKKEVRAVQKGTWRVGEFLQPSNLVEGSWTILNLNGHYTKDSDLYYLQDEIQKTGASVGMQIGKAETPFVTLAVQERDVRHIEQYFTQKKEKGLRLIIVVIPDRLDIAYSQVKQVSELRTGMLTQCLKGQTLRKFSPATAGNILLKLNAKLNGINHEIVRDIRPRVLQTPTILIGADVTHPSPDAVDIPSIAAVAASHDPKAFQYNIEIRLQPPRTEIIQELEEIMQRQLMFFFKKTGYKPLKVIFYRDGVSEGQLPHIMHFELNAIKKAFKRLSPEGNYNPPITFLVVQKRHHIRLFPTDKRFSDDRNFNVQAGTIVDTEITHPTDIDFYLVSHASIQGTARPTKYRCILNDIKLTEDEIEQLTYYLCHMFARCTRSVSYPAPTYYAHLAAFRARALIHNVPIELSNLQRAQHQNLTLQVNREAPMFFV